METRNIQLTTSLLKEAIDELVDFIKPTYGPEGNTVLVERNGQVQVLDDGARLAELFVSEREDINAILSVVRENSVHTDDKLRDGSTGSLLILQALIHEIMKSKKSAYEIKTELTKGMEELKTILTESAHKIKTKEELRQVAKVSFRNDTIADILSALVFDLGSDAIITAEESNTTETTYERSTGFEVASGYVSPYMVTNEKGTAELKKPFILVTNHSLTTSQEIVPIMEKVVATGNKNFVIFAEKVEGEALMNLVINKTRGVLTTLVVNPPHGDHEAFFNDVAVLTGATFIDSSAGLALKDIDVDSFGKADMVVATKDKTTLTGSKGNKEEIQKAILALTEAGATERLAKFTNKVAVIKVGATTATDLKTLTEKMDDAINSVKRAHRGGVVMGAGLSLARAQTSSPILNKTLVYPFNQLQENSDFQVELSSLKPNEVVDFGKKVVGDNKKLGITDPVEVIISGVESAVHLICRLLTIKNASYQVEVTK